MAKLPKGARFIVKLGPHDKWRYGVISPSADYIVVDRYERVGALDRYVKQEVFKILPDERVIEGK